MSRAPLRVALLDSGLSAPRRSPPTAAGRCFVPVAGRVATAPAEPDRLGHGSAVAAVVTRECRSVPVALLDAQIFRNRLVTTPRVVAAALDWATERGAQIVGMSLGLREDRLVLREACRRARATGAVLISAAPLRGGPVFPAAYPGVIRALADARCEPLELSDFGTDQRFGACPTRPAAPDRSGGASFACARVVAAAARLWWAHPEWRARDVVRGLAAAAVHRGPQRPPRPDDRDESAPDR